MRRTKCSTRMLTPGGDFGWESIFSVSRRLTLTLDRKIGRFTMRIKNHIRIFIIATIVWILFLIAGMPDYYLQYSNQKMIIFVTILLIPISIIIAIVFKPIKQQKRLTIAYWYAFYFTVPLAIYDSLYCGLYLGYGINFLFVFWFLSIYYLIPWVLFPTIAIVLNQKYK